MKKKGTDYNKAPSDKANNDDEFDLFFSEFIEMILGPEGASKGLDELTEEEKKKVIEAIAQISGDFTG
ncbi:hypothetical protein [Roseibium album]|uniref:hypothetical protein n=1 Tax=Roseibium album TaxID=311410 RepID=UPI0039192FBA